MRKGRRNSLFILTLVVASSLVLRIGSNVGHASGTGLTVQGAQFWQQGTDGLGGSGSGQESIPTGTGITAKKEGDRFGNAIAGGDFNGDGIADLAIGVPDDFARADLVDSGDDAPPGVGSVHVIYGGSSNGLSTSGGTDLYFNQSSTGMIGTSKQGNRFGAALAAGDFNGDGVDELAITVAGENAVQVVYGRRNVGLITGGNQRFKQGQDGIEGVFDSNDRFGAALATGDFNGDGRDDLAVGAPGNAGNEGSVNIIFGSLDGLTTLGNYMLKQGRDGVNGSAEDGNQFGFSLAAGEFNDDAYDDLAIGVPYEDTSKGAIRKEEHGAVNVIYGGSDGIRSYNGHHGDQLWDQNECFGCSFLVDGEIVEEDNLPGGREPGDRFGYSLTAADFSGDGVDDLAIGIPGEDRNSGAVAILYGRWGNGLWSGNTVGTQLWDQNGCEGFACQEEGDQLQGGEEGDGDNGGSAGSGDSFGHALIAGDFNGDGYNDLAIGVPYEDDGSNSTRSGGAVAVIYGGINGLRSRSGPGNQLWDQNKPGIEDKIQEVDLFGSALAAGDFDGNGAADLAIGVPQEDDNVGAVNVIYGTPASNTRHCCDRSGKSLKDSTRPVVTPQIVGTQGNNGWYVSDVEVTWTIQDPESAAPGDAGCAAATVTADTGGTTFTCSATSEGGTTTESVTIKRDTTPPTITGSVSPGPNANGWNNTDVTVSFICSDNFMDGLSCTEPQQLMTEGTGPFGNGQFRIGFAVDQAGNVVTTTVGGIKIDKTPPLISASRTTLPNTNGWNNTDVLASYTASDSVSGLSSPTNGSFTFTDEAAGQSHTFTVKDLADNSSSATVSGVNIDKSPPQVTCRATPNQLWPPNGKMVPIELAVNVSDSLSGSGGFTLAQALSSESTFDFFQMFAFGTPDTSGLLRAQRSGGGNGRIYTLRYNGIDLAGNSTPCGATITVPHDKGGK